MKGEKRKWKKSNVSCGY